MRIPQITGTALTEATAAATAVPGRTGTTMVKSSVQTATQESPNTWALISAPANPASSAAAMP